LFSDTYIDKAVWTEVVNDAFLKQRTDAICEAFDSWRNPTLGDIGDEIDLEDFLLAHREVFQLIDKQKRKGGKSPMRTSIKGEDIYPRRGIVTSCRTQRLSHRPAYPMWAAFWSPLGTPTSDWSRERSRRSTDSGWWAMPSN